ncbi:MULTISPECIES: uracil phosphoribosyltransferase [Fructobacillus]|jgi:uracil phosphoribosyltransferase|uniref:Uracil phosphoribosyltransferase n=1 Tax=Fructobacillus cardui TaxID=2893170 RepID=A0ABM9MPJ9_9LACO|nr:uracil phosphoribosyltransferase [Fructobacillus sp. EFB-N1]KMK54081.1 Uracil phosphoribosyltransferase [Fructobacillus sp. EFB-N1]CAK1224074.1 Uracil phosphoribosyltransferase (Upp) [Fructobacillus cardui]CAK1230065.1 Uracil phosphoribosyltransferase (Upp) [Fructobacillus cardui]CAK1236858.1 Uracil phosphoribosyltransferase (Upp) [Fructobacillus cardui]
MGQVVEVNHPLIQHKLTIIRDEKVGTKDFRALVDELAMLLTYEASRDLPLEEVRVKTPIQETTKKQLAGKKLAVVPILRAGLGMVDGILQLIPAAKVGHIGMYRDEKTLEPVEYFIKLPEDIDQREVLLVDPMLATGGSAKDAISALKKRGAEQIKLITLVSSPEGIQAVTSAHPDVDIYTASIDEGLNDDGYIVPGLGDAGDRLFGTH